MLKILNWLIVVSWRMSEAGQQSIAPTGPCVRLVPFTRHTNVTHKGDKKRGTT